MGVAQALGLFRGPRLLNLKVKACASSHTSRDRLWRWLGCAAYWSSKSSPLLGERCSQPVERVFQAGLIDGLQARLAGADARALMLIVAQAHVILICLRTYTTAAQHHVLSVVIVHSITMHPDFKCPALAVLGCACQQK